MDEEYEYIFRENPWNAYFRGNSGIPIEDGISFLYYAYESGEYAYIGHGSTKAVSSSFEKKKRKFQMIDIELKVIEVTKNTLEEGWVNKWSVEDINKCLSHTTYFDTMIKEMQAIVVEQITEGGQSEGKQNEN